MAGPTKAERETTLRWDEDERLVDIFSASHPVWRKMERFGIEPTKQSLSADGEVVGKFYRVPIERLFWKIRPQKNPNALRCPAPSALRFRKRSEKEGS